MSLKPQLRVNLTVQNYTEQAGITLANSIKRLALIFDEIYITPPEMTVIKESVMNVVKKKPKKEQEKTIIDYFRDTEPTFKLAFSSFRSPELRDTLLAFEDAGIIKVPPPTTEKLSKDIIEIKNNLILLDIKDKKFNKLSNTKPEDYKILQKILEIKLELIGHPREEKTIHIIQSPQSILDSQSIIDTLLNSESLSSFPIFLDSQHRSEVEYKYNQYKQGLKTLRTIYPDALADLDFKASFGEVAFAVTNELFDSGALALCDPDEIIKYRTAMEEARRKYISEDLVNISQIVKDDPWGERTRTEVTKYIVGKLNRDLAQYENQAKLTYHKFFGQLATHATSVTIGGGAATLLGNVLPNANPWHLLLIGSLVGAAKEGPQLVKSIVDLWIQKKNERGSSIAFVAEFNKRGLTRKK